MGCFFSDLLWVTNKNSTSSSFLFKLRHYFCGAHLFSSLLCAHFQNITFQTSQKLFCAILLMNEFFYHWIFYHKMNSSQNPMIELSQTIILELPDYFKAYILLLAVCKLGGLHELPSIKSCEEHAWTKKGEGVTRSITHFLFCSYFVKSPHNKRNKFQIEAMKWNKWIRVIGCRNMVHINFSRS